MGIRAGFSSSRFSKSFMARFSHGGWTRTVQPPNYLRSPKRAGRSAGGRKAQLEVAQQEGARAKAALKPPHSNRWRVRGSAGQLEHTRPARGIPSPIPSPPGYDAARRLAGLPPSRRLGATSRSGRGATTATNPAQTLSWVFIFCSTHEAILPQVLKNACCWAT